MSRRLAMLALAAGVAMTTSCVFRKGGPDFRRYGRQHTFEVSPTVHRAGDLEVQVLSAVTTETYTVLGSEAWTVALRARFGNRGSRLLTIGMDSMGVFRTGESHATAVYFNEVRLEPGARQELTISIPAGTSSFIKPLALHYKGARMNLQ